MQEFTSVNPFLEGDTIHNEDGTVTSRSMFFWEKQVMRLLYHWTKAGNCLNPNVRITLEDPNEEMEVKYYGSPETGYAPSVGLRESKTSTGEG